MDRTNPASTHSGDAPAANHPGATGAPPTTGVRIPAGALQSGPSSEEKVMPRRLRDDEGSDHEEALPQSPQRILDPDAVRRTRTGDTYRSLDWMIPVIPDEKRAVSCGNFPSAVSERCGCPPSVNQQSASACSRRLTSPERRGTSTPRKVRSPTIQANDSPQC